MSVAQAQVEGGTSAEPSSSDPTKKSDLYKDKIRLKLILASGKTHEFLFTPNDTAADVGKHVYENWPEDWGERPDNHHILRLIFQGRFLHGNVSLGALKLPLGKLTVMHLIPREKLPQPPSQGEREQEKTNESGCRNCCTIL